MWVEVVEMNKFVFFSVAIFVILDLTTAKRTAVTLGVQDRVAILKQQIADQIKHKQNTKNIYPIEDTLVNENVDYEDHGLEPITPINENDPRKKQGKYRLRQIRSTRNFKAVPTVPRVKSEKNNKNKTAQRNHQKPQKNNSTMVKKLTPSDVFYRRSEIVQWTGTMDTWMHCQDLVTPFITGHKTNMSSSKRVTYEDHVVVRLIQLLTEDVADHSKDEIQSILYQISNLHLRLFQWDVAAIRLLLNVINRDGTQRHSFKTIKYGLKQIFAAWHLQVGANVTVLLKQTRLFRPPCVMITNNEGSTKTSKVVRYTKSVPRKKKCVPKDNENAFERDNCED